MNQPSLFDDQRMTMRESIDLSLASLNAYGERYKHWAIAYSGGKDSSATAAFVAWAIKTGQVVKPDTLTILYADTRQELPPLQRTAMAFMSHLQADGFTTKVVMPTLDDRFYVYMFGRGVPPPKNRFRWCTPQLKIEPMQAALDDLSFEIDPMSAYTRNIARQALTQSMLQGNVQAALTAAQIMQSLTPEKFLMITGVRLGESAARDQRIALSCSKDSGECGQGWFQTMPPQSVSDTLAPMLHWRLCHIWDWLYFASEDSFMRFGGFDQPGHHYPELGDIAAVYGDDEARTGCIGCNLASKDTALENLVQTEEWRHLEPLLGLKSLFQELQKPKWRLRKLTPDRKKDGDYAQNGQRMGPLTMDARRYGLERVLDIQQRARVDLINDEELARIEELITLNTWPNGWQGDEIAADIPVDKITVVDSELIVQPLLPLTESEVSKEFVCVT